MAKALTYAEAGVDILAAEENVRRIGQHVRSTHGPQVLGDFGAFAGLFHLRDVKDPLLVASTDGVGSKLQVAIEMNRHDVIGRDLVNLSVNDVLTAGARPIFFLDYIAVHKLEHAVVEALVAGMAAACRENGCALLGGETAQLPDLYQRGHYDLAGFVVGVVERDRLIDGSAVREGDRVWALPSTGLHTNGYTLARKIVSEAGLRLDAVLDGWPHTLGDALLAAHPSYLSQLQPLLDAGVVRSIAHVTGGGVGGNLPRVLPNGLGAQLRWGTWPVPRIFDLLRSAGGLDFDESMRVFNMGLGLVFVTDPNTDARRLCPTALDVGRITRAQPGRERVLVVAAPRD